MEAALKLLSSAKKRRVCIFGDMLELGENAPSYHERIGKIASDLGIELMICVGTLAKYAAFGEHSVWYPDQDQLMKDLPGLLKEGDTVLVKASQGMHLVKTLNYLKSIQ